jgi:hypothetical protein
MIRLTAQGLKGNIPLLGADISPPPLMGNVINLREKILEIFENM